MLMHHANLIDMEGNLDGEWLTARRRGLKKIIIQFQFQS